MRWLNALLVALALCANSALAVQPDEMLADPALEARARALSRELRCMVCQNQSIDDSDAPLAHDLRVLVRERLKAGDSDVQVMDFLTARYGQFVLLRPRLGLDTVVLWFAPAGVLAIGALVIVLFVRRRRRAIDDEASVPLSEAEQARLAELTGRPGLMAPIQAVDRSSENRLANITKD